MRYSAKGQNLTVEQMFLFTIGLLITVSIFFGFRASSEHVSDLGEDDQLYEVATLTASVVTQVAADLAKNDAASTVVGIPDKINSQPYTIKAEGTKIVVVSGNNRTVSVEAAGTAGFTIQGTVFSSAKTLRVEGSNTTKVIRLGRR